MKRATICLLVNLVFATTCQASTSCTIWPRWFQSTCQRLYQVWTQGDNEVYLTGYAWHNRYTYSKAKIKKYNETAWGGGLGKSFYDEKGNWHGLYAFAFLDSHKNLEPIAGYAYVKILNVTESVRAGAGFSVFITARPDLYNNIPFPGLLPWFSLSYKKATLTATYIPGAKGAGNVLFLLGKWLI